MRRLGAIGVGSRWAASCSMFAARAAAAAHLVTGTQRVAEPNGLNRRRRPAGLAGFGTQRVAEPNGLNPNGASLNGPDQPY
jgi:hypothetical protein